MQLFEMQGLLAGKCLPGDMKVNESLAEYLLRKLEDRNELERQLSAKTISEQNIINAFGIKGEDAHSKLVIEYVHGLVAENAALTARTPFAYSYRYAGCETCEGFQNWRWELSKERPPEWMMETGKVTNLVELFEFHETPATDAAIAEIKAPGVDDFAECAYTIEHHDHAKAFAENLRAGRKG